MSLLNFKIEIIQNDLADFYGYNDHAEKIVNSCRGWIISEINKGISIPAIIDAIRVNQERLPNGQLPKGFYF